VHMVSSYDRERGISQWTKNYRTSIESTVDDDRTYAYYDPIDTLPTSGRAWWQSASQTTVVRPRA
jgi:lysine 2,3-aminomutase